MRMIFVRCPHVACITSLLAAACSPASLTVVENERDSGADGKVAAAPDARSSVDAVPDAPSSVDASHDDPECEPTDVCTLGSHCVVKGAGPCNADERLECGADGTYFFDVYPCTPESCDGIADGPDSCEESCSCKDGGMVCHGNCPGNGPYSLCADDCVVSLASGPVFVGAIAADATDVYWTDSERGLVMRTPILGGASATLASQRPTPSGIAIDDASVYWTEARGDIGGYLVRAPKAGGAATTLASGQITPFAVTVDATNVYSIGTEAVLQVPIDGGQVTTLAHGDLNPYGIAVDSADVFWTTKGPNGFVLKVSIGGGAVTTLASGQTNPYGVAANATNVYWTSGGSVLSVPTSGGQVTTLASGTDGAVGLAIDDSSAYWTDNYQYVKSVLLTGGRVFTYPPTLAAGTPAVAVNASGVYTAMAENGFGALLEITPK